MSPCMLSQACNLQAANKPIIAEADHVTPATARDGISNGVRIMHVIDVGPCSQTPKTT